MCVRVENCEFYIILWYERCSLVENSDGLLHGASPSHGLERWKSVGLYPEAKGRSFVGWILGHKVSSFDFTWWIFDNL